MTRDKKEDPIKVPRFEESSGFYVTPERSRIMSKIKNKDTKAEIIFRRALFSRGVRFRVNYKKLPGKPDVSNKVKKLAVFIDGEFWHGFNWKQKQKNIKKNRGFWIPKIERNMQRDREINEKLENMGFRVFRFWEKRVLKDPMACVEEVIDYLNR